MGKSSSKLSRMVVNHREIPPKLEAKSEHWQAWWEDFDSWDGYASYTDLDTAMRSSVTHYLREDYGWDHDDPADEAPEVTLSWAYEHHRWHLCIGEDATGIQLYKVAVYGKKES